MMPAATEKTISLELTSEEQTGFFQILDIATKTGGLNIAQATLFFANKLQAAINAQTGGKPATAPASTLPARKGKKD